MCSAMLFYWKKSLRALVSLSFCAFGILCTSSSWQCFVNFLHYLVSVVVALYISILFALHCLSAYLSISCGPLGTRMLAVLLIASWLWGLCLAVPAAGTKDEQHQVRKDHMPQAEEHFDHYLALTPPSRRMRCEFSHQQESLLLLEDLGPWMEDLQWRQNTDMSRQSYAAADITAVFIS